jgi:Tol biopolymer transport system component
MAKSFIDHRPTGISHQGTIALGTLRFLRQRRSVGLGTVLAIAMTLMAAGPTVGSVARDGHAPSGQFRLAYGYEAVSNPWDHPEGVYVMRGNGTHRRRVSTDVEIAWYLRDFDIDWSPDGTRLAFAGEGWEAGSGWPGIFVVNADGTQQRQISESCWADFGPDWSPDGRLIVFRHDSCERAYVFVVKPSGKDRHRLIKGRQAFWPRWSPDGRFVTFDDRHSQIFTAKRDGTDVLQLSPPGIGTAHAPAYSPDGRRVVFTGLGDICVIGPRGEAAPIHEPVQPPQLVAGQQALGARVCLTATHRESDPEYSPDGSEIVFVSTRTGHANIYKMTSTGGLQLPLTSSPDPERDPTWSPDGRWIAFVRWDGAQYDLYVMRSDGTHERRLTHTPGDELDPAWSPK